MSDTGQPGQTADSGVPEDARPSCGALVAVVQPARWSRRPVPPPPPDPGFVAQLIATAEDIGQARLVQSASATEALSAYRARQRRGFSAGLRTRRVI